MKLSRLLAYSVAGIIAGLLLENKTLKIKQRTKDQGRRLKTKLNKAMAN